MGSTAARRDATVTFVAIVAQADATAAQSAASSLTATEYHDALLDIGAAGLFNQCCQLIEPSTIGAPSTGSCASATVSCSSTSDVSKTTTASLMMTGVICFF